MRLDSELFAQTSAPSLLSYSRPKSSELLDVGLQCRRRFCTVHFVIFVSYCNQSISESRRRTARDERRTLACESLQGLVRNEFDLDRAHDAGRGSSTVREGGASGEKRD